MEIETEPTASLQRFTELAMEKFLWNEMRLLSEMIPHTQEPRSSKDKEPTKAVLKLRKFTKDIVSISEKLFTAFQYRNCHLGVSSKIFEFFHLEDKMRPLMRINEPVRFFLP